MGAISFFHGGTKLVKSGEMIDIYGINMVEKGLKENAIPLNFYQMNYEEFLKARRKLMVQDIKKYFEGLLTNGYIEEENRSLLDIIKMGETNKIEFKSSLRWDYREQTINKKLEYVIIKTITAFLNSEGGVLYIGVKDDGEILGLDNDFKTFGDKGKDGFLLQMDNLITNYLGKDYFANIKLDFVVEDGKEVCVVTVVKSNKEVYIRNEGKEEFYIRANASSIPLGLSECNNYINKHWN